MLSKSRSSSSLRSVSSCWRALSSSSSTPSTFSVDKMEKDARYAPANEVPAHVLQSMSESANKTFSPGFSIKGEALEGRPAYLDFQATTPLDPRVLDSMLPFLTELYGNPHSKTHSFGWETESAIEQARESVASLIGASSKEIIFTSGATESNNIAIKGVARFYKDNAGKKRHIITTQTEHKCVLDSCRALESEGLVDVTYLPVQANGLVDVADLQAAIREKETVLVSIMGVNNEIGVIQPLAEIGRLCRDKRVFFHSDLAQMAGRMEIDVDKLKIDLASVTAHKMYGPKGVGALYVRRKPRVRLEPLFSGGGQERGLRSGTLAPHLIAGFGAAAEIAKQDMEIDTQWISYLANKLKTGILTRIPSVVLNGDEHARYVGNLNFSFAYVEGESLLMALKNIAVSSGSACTSASLEPSYVLRAIGSDDASAHSSLRFGIGRFTTDREIDLALDLLEKHVKRLREMSPLWELVQEGIDLDTIQWTQDAHHH